MTGRGPWQSKQGWYIHTARASLHCDTRQQSAGHSSGCSPGTSALGALSAPSSRGCSGSPAGLCPGAILQGQLDTGSIPLPQTAKPGLQGSCSSPDCTVVCCALGLGLPAQGTGLVCHRRQRSFSFSLTEGDVWAGKGGEAKGIHRAHPAARMRKREWELSSEES